MKKILYSLIAILVPILLTAQVVTVAPAFPKATDEVTITFDATQGTAGLKDCNCDVYLHTGVITSTSTSDSDWKHVVTSWGVANSAWKMTKVSGENNLYTYKISPSINSYYSIGGGEIVKKMAFVFRNADGSKEGKETGGEDIFVEVYPDDVTFSIALNSPTQVDIIVEKSSIIPVKVSVSEEAGITLYENGVELFYVLGESLDYNMTASQEGTHFVEIIADNGSETKSISFNYTVALENTIEDLPVGTEDGISVKNDSTVILVLYAPGKDHVFAIGDFNDWEINTDYQLTNTTDSIRWWIEISGLDINEEYGFQYLVNGNIRIGDPYSEIVLDPWNDKYISSQTFPDLKPYPKDKTSGIVSVFTTSVDDFVWENDEYERPQKEKLIIYELLLRDFLKTHNFQSLTDTLEYLERLGVNAIELMPVNEFEGNQSWGYNPSYHYALDKYYGSPEAFKILVDEAHKRGMAVIIDIVYNHAFSQCPLAKLYWDDGNFRPSADNPWLNQEAKHPYNVGYDFNHLSQATKYYVKRGLKHYLEDFHVDGFRFDLSKGFTQKQSYDNGQMAAYDGSRIGILKDYADFIWDVDDSAYVILEHFATNSEEKELSDYGMMLWGNMNHEYNEASMGYPSNLSWVTHKQRGWSKPHLIGYMESHDEERAMYKNLKYGNSNGAYTVKNLSIALDRMELNGAFFFTLPGPKMMWQFGELGYDFSINRCEDGSISDNCRLSPKPIRWDYQNDDIRKSLYDTWSKMIKMRDENEVFNTSDFNYSLNTFQKYIHLNSSNINVTIIGNFDVKTESINPQFQQPGWWYDYLSGDSINVINTSALIELKAGEYHIYSDKRMKGGGISSTNEQLNVENINIYPIPADEVINISFYSFITEEVNIEVLNLQGKLISRIKENILSGKNQIGLSIIDLNEGVYILKILGKTINLSEKLIVVK